MDDINNMWTSFEKWVNTYNKLHSAIKSYTQNISETGSKALGTIWTKSLNDLDQHAKTINSITTVDMDILKNMYVCDSIDSAQIVIEKSIDILTSKQIQQNISIKFSHTFIDNLKSSVKNLLNIKDELLTVYREIIKNISTNDVKISDTPLKLFEDFKSVPRGLLSTEFFISIMKKIHSAESESLLEAAKDMILGESESVEGIEKDSEYLKKYHPTQSMTYIQLIDFSNSSIENSIDITFPQSTYSVKYDILPLISRKKILEYGTIAPLNSGINYKLIERLRTIKLLEKPKANVQPSSFICNNITIAIGNGEYKQLFAPFGAKWAPFAGMRPRVDKYNELFSDIVMEKIENDYSPQVRNEYESKAISESIIHPEILAHEITNEFEKIFDAAPPTNLHDFYKLAIGDELPYDGYICKALNKISEREIAECLYKLSIQMNLKIQIDAVENELRISQALTILNSSKLFWRNLKNSFNISSEIFSLHPTRIKYALLNELKKLVIIVSEKNPIIYKGSSLKLMQMKCI